MTDDFIKRRLDLRQIVEKKSIFLFGPRQTGKSTLIRQQLSGVRTFNLLDSDVLLSLSRRPAQLREEILPSDELVVIDEIQKLPALLDEVHLLIEERSLRFLLTGSSARKLRRGGVNLLGGRARSRALHPFSYCELDAFDLRRALDIGLLPPIYLSDAPQEDLRAYVGNYLIQEIAAEALTRSVPAFSRFLEVAALCNAQLINYSSIASDAQVPKSTVQNYFQILKDTLIASELPAWKRTIKRKPIRTSKFYFFDSGVVRYLQHRRGLKPRSPEFGEAFETYMHHELRTYIDTCEPDGSLAYWRSKSGFEVDFVLNDSVAVELEAKAHVGERDLRGLRALGEEGLLDQLVLVSLEPRPRHVDGIDILPWSMFLDQLWAGAYARPQ
ncbi:MAG: ATP-binding protein [Deltaproteobacteria bacterium]|nr:ATP-binding protein [Deltaproteobacteria bacterium]